MRPADESPFASLLAKEPIVEAGGTVRYRYAFAPGGLQVIAQRGQESATGLIEWVFGAAGVGNTPVGRTGDAWFEHRLSYYTELGRASLTPGQPFETPTSARGALGQIQSPEDAFRCFNCHATGVRRTATGPDLASATPGLQCERCHGPGGAHAEAAGKRAPATEIRKAIFNAGRLQARALVEVCGECHRTPKPGMLSESPESDDPLSIRYQPFGLMASRCFQKSGKLSCLTCHDPHENARRSDPSFYTAKCLGCHSGLVPAHGACKRALKQNCLPCHMQRASAAPFLTFTDHRIRVY